MPKALPQNTDYNILINSAIQVYIALLLSSALNKILT